MAINKYTKSSSIVKSLIKGDDEEEKQSRTVPKVTVPKVTTTAPKKEKEEKEKTLSFSEALSAPASTVKHTGASLESIRNQFAQKQPEQETKPVKKTVDVSAWTKALSDDKTMSKVKASQEVASKTLTNTPEKQKQVKDALDLRNQEARVEKLRREEEAKKKAYEDLPVLDKLFNISAENYASDESRVRKAAEVEYDRMRMTPEEFEAQHKADLGESLYQIAHSGATGVAGSFAKAVDVTSAIGAGIKKGVEGFSDKETFENSSFGKEFMKGYQDSLTKDDSLYDQVYAQYEREYEENRRIDGEINTLTKYAAQAANSIGEQAVMLWTSSLSSALFSGGKIGAAVASKADELKNSGKKGLKLLGKTLEKVNAGNVGGAASMFITSSASSTEEAINNMREQNERRHALGVVGEYTEDQIARNAALYGVLNGLSETVLEYAIGGVTGAAENILPSPKVKNPILTATLSYLKGAAGEGFEEMVQTLASTGLEKLTYNDRASVDWQEVIDSGIVGALSGAAIGAPAMVQNTKLGVSAMRDVSNAAKAAKKAETDASGAFVAVSSSAKAYAYTSMAESIRQTGNENAETLAGIYEWAADQHLKIAENLTSDETRARVQEQAKKENKKEAKREAERTTAAVEREANAAASVKQTAEETPNADVNAIDREVNTFEREVMAPAPVADITPNAPNATVSGETQTQAQAETTSVQNKIRAEVMRRDNVSAENGDATVATDLALQLQQSASKKTNLKTVQKLADAVRIIQSGQMPDKSYNEALNLLKNEDVRKAVETELGTDTPIDPKNIRPSLENVSKRYAETAERADMDSLSEEITAVVERSAEDKVTLETGQMTRAEFVRSFGAELAQRGLAADDVFDNLLAHELKTTAPNADVNASEREANVLEHEANAPLQTAETPVMSMAEAPNADVNAITSDVNTVTAPNADVNASEREANVFERDVNTPLQADVSRETAPNADVNVFEREANTFEREVNGEVIPRVHREFSPEKQLTEVQNESIKALEMLSRAVNADIYLYDSSDDEKYRFSSGRYDPASDRIYIDINAGAQYEGTILRTAGHELVHYAKRWSPESFRELSSFVEQTLTESGADITALMNEKRAQAFRYGNTLSEETAYEEVIADACQTMLTDTDALSRLAETKPTVFERVMEFLRDFVDNIRRVYSDYKPTTEAGRVIAEQTRETADRLSEIYSRTLIEAGKARTEAQQMLSGQPSELDAAKTEQGGELFDYRAIRDDMETYREKLTKWGGMSDEAVDDLMKVVGLATDIVEQNKKKLDYGYDSDPEAERPFNPVKANSDKLYKISLDFSTLCRKRIVQAVVAENLERALERPLSREEAIQVRAALTEVQKNAKTIEVACALCYVEAARLKTPAQIQKFMDNRATVLYNHFAERDRATKDAINEAERAKKIELGYDPKAAVKGKDKNAVRDAKTAARKTYQLTDAQKAEIAYAESLPVTMFTTSKGLTELAENHYDIYKAYADAVRAASHSKGLESDVPWRAGDSDSITDGLIRRMNEGAGIRSQSWSDFQAIHLLDEIAMTIEMAARGAKMHSYSKVPDYVRLLGLTGHMINMSLIPTRDGNGFDAVEGMPYEVMLMLRDQYPDTAGSICIGVNDEQILRLLDSEEIDYVIPYHHSGNSIATRRALKIPEWTSYQDIQTEKGGDGPAFAEWFDINRARETAARENANPTDPAAKEKYGVQYGAYKAMQEAADRYLQLCAERGLTPKFKGKVSGRNVDFTTHPNYWKLLIDRKMVNQITGEVIEQKPVQPIFDPAVIYGDPANGNVGGILGRALEYYDVHQADVMYAVAEVTRSMGKDIGAKSEVIEQIIGESVEDIRNGDVLFEYRETDDTYRKAVEAGDTEKAQKMVDDAARAAGYTVKAYHGTPTGGFTSFDPDRIGSNTGVGRGRFSFTSDKDTADVYANKNNTAPKAESLVSSLNKLFREYDSEDIRDLFIGATDEGMVEWDADAVIADGAWDHDYVDFDMNWEDDDPTRYASPGEAKFAEKSAEYEGTRAYIIDVLKREQRNAPDSTKSFFEAAFKMLESASPKRTPMTYSVYLPSPDKAYQATADNYNRVAWEAAYDPAEVVALELDNGETRYFVSSPEQIKSAEPVTYDDNGNVIPLSERFNLSNPDIRYDYRISGNEATEPHASQRDIASSPEFEAFIKAYDAVHGEGAARTIVRTTEQFDRERARQRKREATAAQMARLPDTEAKLRRMAEAAERSRRDEAKINAIKNPAVRRAKLSAHLAKQEAEAIRRVAEIDAQRRVADQAYRDNVEMQSRLAEQQARAEERLRGVKAEYQERLDRERVRTAQAKFEGQQNASERVQRERYQQWWKNRIHEEDLRQARAEGRENVRQAREEERNWQTFRNRNADVLTEQQRQHAEYLRGQNGTQYTPEDAYYASAHKNLVGQKTYADAYAAAQEQARARTGAKIEPSVPDAVIKPFLNVGGDPNAQIQVGDLLGQHSNGKKTVADIREKVRKAGEKAYVLFVNAQQPLDSIAKKQEKAGFLATSTNYVTAVRNASAVADYILTDALTDRDGHRIGESFIDVMLIKDKENYTVQSKNGEKKISGQEMFDTYLLLNQTVDRMSFVAKAEEELADFVAKHPWLEGAEKLGKEAFAKLLYSQPETEQVYGHEWQALSERVKQARNKPVYVLNGSAVTADQAKAMVTMLETEQPWLKERAEKLYQWWDTFMREWAVGVSISEEEYEVMRTIYPHYVPTFRADKPKSGTSANKGRDNRSGEVIKRATGGSSKILPVENSFAEQVQKIVKLKKENDLRLNLVDTALLNGDGSLAEGLTVTPDLMGYTKLMTVEDFDSRDHEVQTLTKTGDGYTVTAWDNGKPVTANIPVEVFESLNDLFGIRDQGIRSLTNLGRLVTTPMKMSTTTLNLNFAGRNPVRDILTGLIQAEGGVLTGMGSYAVNYGLAWHKIMTGAPEWQEYKALGGKSSNHYRNESGLQELAKSLKSKKAAKFIMLWGETTESAARFAAYLQYLRTHGDTRENRLRAMTAAAEITTDFSRVGSLGRLVNAWTPYWNAAVQGTDRFWRDVRDGKLGVRLTRTSLIVGVISGLAMWLRAREGREEEYEGMSDYYKDRYFHFPAADGKWFRIPKDQLYTTILGSAVERSVEWLRGREDPFKDFDDTVLEALNIPGAGAETVEEIIPSALGDVIIVGEALELHMNKDFIGRDIVPSQFKDYSSGKFAPNSAQYDEDTSAIAYAFAKALNYSPIKVDYLLKSYFGDFYHSLISVADLGLIDALTTDELKSEATTALKEAAQQMFGKAWYTDSVYSNRYTGEYYDMLDAMAAQIAADKVHLPEGEYKNTLTYRTKQAIENKYGRDISAAYKTARSAVSEAEKRDAREEAVTLSIEALDFYEQAMAGKYGDDPAKAVDYEPYGADVSQALSKLAQYEKDYQFEPDGSYAPEELTVNETTYTLTDEDKDQYKAFYREIYSGCVRRTILSQEYRMAGGSLQAEMLEDAADEARDDTTAQMREYLSAKVPSKYSSKIMEALKSLKAYEGDYQFEPNSTYAPDSLTVGKDKYPLTDEQKDEYMSMYVKNYESHLSKIIDSKQYKSANPADRAKMLAEAATDARNETGAQMKSLLSGIDVKYVADSRYTKYEPYGDTIRDALLDLTDYEKGYQFEPNDTYAPESLSVGKTKYELTHDQKDRYKALYVTNYKTNVGRVVSSKEYRDANAKRRAELLEKAQKSARDATKERFKQILSGK